MDVNNQYKHQGLYSQPIQNRYQIRSRFSSVCSPILDQTSLHVACQHLSRTLAKIVRRLPRASETQQRPQRPPKDFPRVFPDTPMIPQDQYQVYFSSNIDAPRNNFQYTGNLKPRGACPSDPPQLASNKCTACSRPLKGIWSLASS